MVFKDKVGLDNIRIPGLLCPISRKDSALIKHEFPGINIVMGTHQPADRDRFVQGVKELLCQSLARPQTMNDLIRGSIKIPQD
jgi:hypothetical protein